MRKIVFFCFLSAVSFAYSQNSLRFENRKMYLGEISINNAYGINFNYENISSVPIKLSYEPITDLVNTTYTKDSILPGAKGSLKLNFYPEQEGPFNERIYIIVNEKEKIELSIYGSVSSISKSYRSLTESNKLFGDRDIAFMVVDAQTYQGIPHAKVFIKNVANNKSYIGVANRFGILINRIPEGKYNIQALVANYGKDILDIKLDANRNVAMILLDKPETKDSLIKIDMLSDIVALRKDSTVAESKPDSAKPIAEVKEISTKAPFYDPNPSKPLEVRSNLTSETITENHTELEHKTLNLILLIDVSQSMEKLNRMETLKKSIIRLVKNYHPLDYMAILTFNDQVETLMERTHIEDKGKATEKVNSILPSGTTDGVLGLDKAFEILAKNYMSDAINMVIIASDGKMNKYAYDDKAMLEKIEKMNEGGILTSVLGFGNSQSHKTKLNKMAESGGGVYIDMSVKNQESVLLDDIYSTLLQVK